MNVEEKRTESRRDDDGDGDADDEDGNRAIRKRYIFDIIVE